uniref:Uncharacterized protein n=1 Tax=Glossina palpalis gambiensis TaxID=67801 RepID=A0A1B0BAL6_9MUSC
MYTLLLVKYYYFLAREFTKPLRFLLKASAFNNEESQALSTAIDCVAMSNNENLAESLLGKVDGSPRDPRYLFRLYMARRHIRMRQKRLPQQGSKIERRDNKGTPVNDVLLLIARPMVLPEPSQPALNYKNILNNHVPVVRCNVSNYLGHRPHQLKRWYSLSNYSNISMLIVKTNRESHP